MCRAGAEGDADWARQLIAANADVNVQAGHGWGPMHSVTLAAKDGKIKDAVPFMKVLLEARADMNVKDQAGRTPLVFAARSGHLELVGLFKDAKELNLDGHFPVSALGRAFRDGHASVAEALLNMGHHHHRGDSLGVPIHQAREVMKDAKLDKMHHEARRLLTPLETAEL